MEVRDIIIIKIIIIAIMVMVQVRILGNKEIILEVQLNGPIIGPSNFTYDTILVTQNNNVHNYLITICKLMSI
jgi:hypothetical protein